MPSTWTTIFAFIAHSISALIRFQGAVPPCRNSALYGHEKKSSSKSWIFSCPEQDSNLHKLAFTSP